MIVPMFRASASEGYSFSFEITSGRVDGAKQEGLEWDPPSCSSG